MVINNFSINRPHLNTSPPPSLETANISSPPRSPENSVRCSSFTTSSPPPPPPPPPRSRFSFVPPEKTMSSSSSLSPPKPTGSGGRRGSNVSIDTTSASPGAGSSLPYFPSSPGGTASALVNFDLMFKDYIKENESFLQKISEIRSKWENFFGLPSRPQFASSFASPPLPSFMAKKGSSDLDWRDNRPGGSGASQRRASAPTQDELKRVFTQMKKQQEQNNEISNMLSHQMAKTMELNEQIESGPKSVPPPPPPPPPSPPQLEPPRWEPEKLIPQPDRDRGEEFALAQRYLNNLSPMAPLPDDSPLAAYMATTSGSRRGSANEVEQSRCTLDSSSMLADTSTDSGISPDYDNSSKTKTDENSFLTHDYTKFSDMLNGEINSTPPTSPPSSSSMLNGSAPIFQLGPNSSTSTPYYLPPPSTAYPSNLPFGQIFGLNYFNYPSVMASALGYNLTSMSDMANPLASTTGRADGLNSLVRDDPLELKAKDHREAASRQEDCINTYSLPNFNFKPPERALYSTKVFLGGVPWEMTDAEMLEVFKSYGAESVQRPGKDVRLSRASKGQDKAGYLYLIFNNPSNVTSLMDTCKLEFSETGHKFFYTLTSKRSKEKRVQVIPWNTEDTTFHRYSMEPNPKLEQNRTVFLGALHGMMTADSIARALQLIFGPVEYVGLDIDKYKYPTGSGKAMFVHPESYQKAIKDGFVKIKSDRFEKTIQIDEYLDDAQCGSCGYEKGPVYCKGCNVYFCKSCWNKHHNGGKLDHQILMKAGRIGGSSSPVKC